MIGARLKQLREEKEMTQRELADLLKITPKAISFYELGDRQPSNEVLLQLADYFGVSTDYLLGKSDIKKAGKSIFDIPGIVPIKKQRVPLLGDVAAGEPIYADEHIESFVECSGREHVDFALKVHGDSMIGARILDGDIVFVRQQDDIEDGEIAVVLVNDSTTLKRVYKGPGYVQLVSENSKYPPMVFSAENCDTCKILGKAIYFQSNVR